jgi:thiamine biosynthesis protein ThiI
MFVPKNPVTKPKLYRAIQQEEAIEWEPLLEHTLTDKVQKFVYQHGEFHEDKNWTIK